MVDVSKTLGALLVGGLVAAVFSGILVVQVFSYFKNYPLDLQRVKLLVVVVSFLDACHTTFVAISLWDDLVNHFGDSARADYIPWSLALTIAVTAVLTFLVHCFLVHRIYKLSMANLYITIPLDVIACLRLGSACLTTVKMIELRSLKTFISRYTWSFTLGLALSSLLDILITGLLCYLLMSGRKKNSPIKHILDSIMLYAFELGALTCAAAIAAMICWLAMPSNLIFMGFHFVIAKFYANSLLATLNTRKPLKQPTRSQSYSGERYYGPDSRHRSKRISANTELNNIASLQIKVDEVTTRTVDLNQYKDSRSSLYHVESC